MSTHAIYRLSDGLIVSHFTGSDKQLVRNIPEGHASLEGSFDALSQRVDIDTGSVVDYQPPQPSADHEWNADSRRWVLRADVAQARQADAMARTEMQSIELADLRAMREALLLLLPPDSEPAKRLAVSESRVNELRPAVIPPRQSPSGG